MGGGVRHCTVAAASGAGSGSTVAPSAALAPSHFRRLPATGGVVVVAGAGAAAAARVVALAALVTASSKMERTACGVVYIVLVWGSGGRG